MIILQLAGYLNEYLNAVLGNSVPCSWYLWYILYIFKYIYIYIYIQQSSARRVVVDLS